MNESSSFKSGLEILSRILIRCFVLGAVFITLWFIFFLVGGELGYTMHAKWFQISRHEYDLLNYYGIAFVKGFMQIQSFNTYQRGNTQKE